MAGIALDRNRFGLYAGHPLDLAGGRVIDHIGNLVTDVVEGIDILHQ